MSFFKRLVMGKLSLPLTFWGCGVLGNIFIVLLAYLSFTIHSSDLLRVVFLIKWIIAIMVLSGIFLILRYKEITFWGILAFIIMLLNFINSTMLAIVAITQFLK